MIVLLGGAISCPSSINGTSCPLSNPHLSSLLVWSAINTRQSANTHPCIFSLCSHVYAMSGHLRIWPFFPFLISIPETPIHYHVWRPACGSLIILYKCWLSSCNPLKLLVSPIFPFTSLLKSLNHFFLYGVDVKMLLHNPGLIIIQKLACLSIRPMHLLCEP